MNTKQIDIQQNKTKQNKTVTTRICICLFVRHCVWARFVVFFIYLTKSHIQKYKIQTKKKTNSNWTQNIIAIPLAIGYSSIAGQTIYTFIFWQRNTIQTN